MKCLETRTTAEGFKRRRYESASGARRTTIEVPIEVWRQVQSDRRTRGRAAQHRRAEERRSKQRQAIALFAAGKDRPAIAKALGASLRSVQRWTRERHATE